MESTSISVVRTETPATQATKLAGTLISAGKWFEMCPDVDTGLVETTTRADDQVPDGYQWERGSY